MKCTIFQTVIHLFLLEHQYALLNSFIKVLLHESVYKKVLEKPHCDLTTKISHFKKEMKKILLSKQNEGDKNEWQNSNFKLC